MTTKGRIGLSRRGSGRRGMMDWSGSDDLKGITGVSGNQFTAGSTVIVVRQIIVVAVFQFQVQMLTRSILSLCPLHA